MRLLFLLSLSCLLLSASASAQCYQTFLNDGKNFVRQGKWDKAIEAFEDGKRCQADKPANGDATLNTLIGEARQKKQAAAERKKQQAAEAQQREQEAARQREQDRQRREAANREDDGAWDIAQSAQNAAACQRYLDKYPAGRHITHARQCVKDYSDSDGDGVLNRNDDCPTEKGTAKNKGCKEKNLPGEAEKTQLTKKEDIASAVGVKNIVVDPVKVYSNGKEKSYTKASGIDKLKICFITMPNKVVPAGEETFYLRIVDPTGAPLAIESLGSGVATDKSTDQDFRYTTNATCNYSNSYTQVCSAWQPGQDFVKGKYSIEVYNKGYLVGNSVFLLK